MGSITHVDVTARQINAGDWAEAHVFDLGLADIDGLEEALGSLAPAAHDHDDRYYTETEVDALLAPLAGSSGWFLRWLPGNNEPPTANFATFDVRNNHPVLDFDATTQEAAIFSGVMPAGYTGAGVTVSVWCALTSATTGTVGWDVAIERMDASSLDIDADSFAAAKTVAAATVPGTSGQLLKMSVAMSNGAEIDSLAAGEMFRIRIRRDVANDTAGGDAELLAVMMVSQ